MADAAAMRQALVRLSFTNEAATALVNQGVDTLELIEHMTEDEIRDLIKVIRQPGGMIDNPDADEDGQPPETGMERTIEDATIKIVSWLNSRYYPNALVRAKCKNASKDGKYPRGGTSGGLIDHQAKPMINLCLASLLPSTLLLVVLFLRCVSSLSLSG